jgi:hypothetical protein
MEFLLKSAARNFSYNTGRETCLRNRNSFLLCELWGCVDGPSGRMALSKDPLQTRGCCSEGHRIAAELSEFAGDRTTEVERNADVALMLRLLFVKFCNCCC